MLKEEKKIWIAQRADPYVIRHTDGIYYFMASVPAYDRIVLRSAEKLEELADAEEVTIWMKHETGTMGNHIWAPELHYIKGHWLYLFCCRRCGGQVAYQTVCTGMYRQNPMTDAWVERGMMQCAPEDEFSFRSFSLDATVFENHGEYYYVWAEKVGVGKMISNLYIARMESPVKLATVQVLLTTPDYEWERRGFWVNEGPCCFKASGKNLSDLFSQ